MGYQMQKTIFVQAIKCIDPETGWEIDVELHKDPSSGAIFGIDSIFLERVSDAGIRSPYNEDVHLEFAEAKAFRFASGGK